MEKKDTVQLHFHPYFNKKNFLSDVIPYFDNYDLEDVIWALATRSLPNEMDIIKKSWGSHSDPVFHRSGSDAADSTLSRGIIYAVKPYEWLKDFPPVNIADEQMRSQALNKWKDIFKGRLQII